MPNKTKHTPTPWGIEWTETTAWIGPMRRSGDGKIETIVCSIDREGLTDEALARNDADAKQIVRAVNGHDELVQLARIVIGEYEEAAMGKGSNWASVAQAARAALAKATGGKV